MNAKPLRILNLTLPVLLLVAVVGLYANALNNPFLMDDIDAIEHHPDVVAGSGILTLWRHDYWAGRAPEDTNLYRPVTILSYYLNARITGLKPWPFRWVNLMLLALLGLLVARWVGAQTHPLAGAAASLLLVVHPSLVSIINNVVGRADLLAMVGVVGALWLHGCAIERGSWRLWDKLWMVLVVLLGLGAKETGVLLIPAVVLQGWIHGSTQSYRFQRQTLILIAVPALLYMVGRTAAVGVGVGMGPSASDLTVNPLLDASPWQRVAGAFSVAWFYGCQTVCPRLTQTHLPDQLPKLTSPSSLLGLLLVVAAVLGLVKAIRARHWLAVVLLIVIGHYLMVGNLLMAVFVYAEDRLMLPFLLAGVSVVVFLSHRAWPRVKLRWPPRVLVALLGVVWVTAAATAVIQRNGEWASIQTLMKRNYDRQPHNAVAQYLYASTLAEINQHEKAYQLLRLVIERHPDRLQPRHQMAIVCIALNRFDQAEGYYQAIVRRNRQDLRAHSQLAALALMRADLAVAGKHLEVARAIGPVDRDVMHNLAVLAVMRGDIKGAIDRYRALLRQYPRHEQGRMELEQLTSKGVSGKR